MALANGLTEVHSKVNGRQDEPLPSTLAAHLAPVNGVGEPGFDHLSFDALLDEALGCDDNGQPNLGNDVGVNQTLIRVIFEAGIDPILKS